MPIAIVLAFDGASTTILDRVYKNLNENNFNSYYQLVMPHITLKIYDTIDLQVIMERIDKLCDNLAPFRVQFSSYGYFASEESVLFLNPKASIELLTIQEKISDLFEDFQVGVSSKTWVPHCTLATDIPIKKIGEAIEIATEDIIMKMGAPFYVDVHSIGTVEFKTGPSTIISINECKFKKKE